MITLQPIAMATPNSVGIYAPINQVAKMIEQAEFNRFARYQVRVSFADDGIKNPIEMTAYALGLDCWYIIE